MKKDMSILVMIGATIGTIIGFIWGTAMGIIMMPYLVKVIYKFAVGSWKEDQEICRLSMVEQERERLEGTFDKVMTAAERAMVIMVCYMAWTTESTGWIIAAVVLGTAHILSEIVQVLLRSVVWTEVNR